MHSATLMGSKIFGALIRARQASGYTQTHIAKQLGISRGHFCNIENGHKEATFPQICKWAEVLGIALCIQTMTGVAE